MNKIPPIQYLFRKPKYPVIVDIDGNLVCGKSASTLARRLSKTLNLQEKTYNTIDSAGEGWAFYPRQWLLSPLTLKKRWTKLEIVKLYNERKNIKSEEKTYSEKSLSSKRLDSILSDIFELLNKT